MEYHHRCVNFLLTFLLTENNASEFFFNIWSSIITLNTGSPQGCVLSAFLFIIYTNILKSSYNNISLVKYTYDTVIIGLIENNDIVNYQKQVSDVVSWCTSHSLISNVKKTKELIFDFSKSAPYHEPLTIQGCDVEICNQFKYFGVVIDDQLSWSYHSDRVVSKCKQKLFLHLLKSFNVNSTILYRFYKSLTESVINYNCITWWNSLSKQKQNRVNRICKQACKVIGLHVSSPGDMYVKMSLSKVSNIIKIKIIFYTTTITSCVLIKG